MEYINGSVCTSEGNNATDIVTNLCEGGVHRVRNENLENTKAHYRRYDTEVTFRPPEEGANILLMEHFVNTRNVSENSVYRLEKGFDKNCIVYHVERHILHSDNYYDPDNKVVLSYRVGQHRREMEIMYMYFFCGFYCAKELDEEQLRIVMKYREIVDEDFDINRF